MRVEILFRGAVHEGSAKISGAHADNEEILVAIDAGTYNVRKATCTYYCISCDGEVLTYLVINDFAVAKSASTQLYFEVQTNTGSTYANSGTWSSSNTSVITVGSSSGVATGTGSGKSSMLAYNNYTNVYNSSYCAYDPSCPYNAVVSATGSGSGLQVTNVSPSNLVLGGSGFLTIAGSGFSSLYSPTVQFASGSGITTGAPTVSSDTQMTVSYQVTCSAMAGSQTLQIGASADGGVSGATWAENVVLPSAPAPTIKLGGNTISGTQSVVVGQQIALSSSVSLPPCTSISNQQWTPSASGTAGTPIGGYSTSTSSGSVTPLPANTNSTYTFYWAYPASSVQATYQYTMAGGGGSVASPVATGTFNVTGVSGVTLTSTGYSGGLTIQNWSNSTCVSPTGNYLVYGTITFSSTCALLGSKGMTFTTNGTQSGGSLSLVQIVDSGSVSGGLACTIVPGLDTAYPYPYLNDSPAALLKSTYTSLSRNENFTMYVMWQSSTASSIPVPVGYQKWGFSGSASCTTSCGTKSNWKATTQSSGTSGGFVLSQASQANQGYPTWTGLVACN